MSDLVNNENNDNSVKIKKMVFVALFAALIAVGAWIRIPLPFVPITLQTFFVLLAAVTLGRNWGPVCIIVYLLVGLIGYPVFAGGSSGLGVILGPTGGYLYSFVIVAFIVGFLSEKANKNPPIFLLKPAAFILKPMASLLLKDENNLDDINTYFLKPVVFLLIALLGSLLILSIGTVHLSFFANISLTTAFKAGFVPFVLGDIVKSIGVALVASIVYKKINFKNIS
ncbi:MAG: biotin transporter BioY [Methanimicrococcus sp.]|nr:biotin transporter BioY [Methanimicrococcus sp.]